MKNINVRYRFAFFRTIRGMDMYEITIPVKEFSRCQHGVVFFYLPELSIVFSGRFLLGLKCDVCINEGLVKWLVENAMWGVSKKTVGHKLDG